MTEIQLYKLSEAGKSIPWEKYKDYGYGITDWDKYHLCQKMGPMTHWKKDLTLGEIEDFCPSAAAGIARNFVLILGKPEYAVPDGLPRVYK